ncbi:hypothetical protein HAX54_027298, partial [Datura stramonium]|nr:hypothetical protein [Datura stramonium]
ETTPVPFRWQPKACWVFVASQQCDGEANKEQAAETCMVPGTGKRCLKATFFVTFLGPAQLTIPTTIFNRRQLSLGSHYRYLQQGNHPHLVLQPGSEEMQPRASR